MEGPVDLLWIITGIAKVIVIFGATLLSILFLIYAERKLVAFMQVRIGPNRAGPKGLLQTLADGIKLFFKEQVTPIEAKRALYVMAPLLTLAPPFITLMLVPIGDAIEIAGRKVYLQGVDVSVGLLVFLAMSSMAVYGVTLAGWSSGSKYPLLGGVRASAQMISYETGMALALIPPVIMAGSLSTRAIVLQQAGTWFGFVPKWMVFPHIVPFLVFMACAVAETNRAPFDLVEAESELVGGFNTEYSGIRFAMLMLSEYAGMVAVSAIAVTVFLGGWNGPRLQVLPWLWPMVWFFVKLGVLIFVFIWIRATLPRFRYDQLMRFGWKVLIPVALLWLLGSAGVQAYLSSMR
ncbi:MAG: NADH-quinone oxidoreductase subunit NuoH [Acidimicrobiia bacterium]